MSQNEGMRLYTHVSANEGMQDPALLTGAAAQLPCSEDRGRSYGLQHAEVRLMWRRALLVCLAGFAVVTIGTLGAYYRFTEPSRMQNVPAAMDPLRWLEGPAVTTAFLRWARHPEKCLSVPVSGDKVELWDCEDIPDMKFVVPPNKSTGPIVWASNPKQCLYAPGGSRLQLWSCDQAPKPENTQWLISPGGGGRIHLAANPEKCLDVPGGSTLNGNLVQVGHCGEPGKDGKIADLAFAGYVSHPDPTECEEGVWSDWSVCSATCGWGKRGRTRNVTNKQGQACLSTPASELDACIHYECIRVLDDHDQDKPTRSRALEWPMGGIQGFLTMFCLSHLAW